MFLPKDLSKNAALITQKNYSKKEEDRRVFTKLGIKPVNLGFIDAAWRKKENYKLNLITKLLPDLIHLCSTTFHYYLRGKIHISDKKVIKEITNTLKNTIKNSDQSVIFCPLGIGKHVDRLIIDNICSNNLKNVIY